LTAATCDGFPFLYQSITARHAKEVLANSGEITGPSFWGTERVARQFGEQQGATEWLILRVHLRRFAGEKLRADNNCIGKPLRYPMDPIAPWQYLPHANHERTRWPQPEVRWQDSLRIYESLCYEAPIRITEADVMR
jgi:hypothetical protein